MESEFFVQCISCTLNRAERTAYSLAEIAEKNVAKEANDFLECPVCKNVSFSLISH